MRKPKGQYNEGQFHGGDAFRKSEYGFAQSHPKEHSTWLGMRARCYHTGHVRYHRYGGRGIKICDRWQNFENFYADMGNRPEGCSIERRDNDKDYSPDNCYWATAEEQQDNKSSTLNITYQGRTMPAYKWALEIGINPKTLRQRIYRGMSPEDAVALGKGNTQC